jgi:hypothetical protein
MSHFFCTCTSQCKKISCDVNSCFVQAFVSFRVTYSVAKGGRAGDKQYLVEKSRFVKEGDRWLYRERIPISQASEAAWLATTAPNYVSPEIARKSFSKGKPQPGLSPRKGWQCQPLLFVQLKGIELRDFGGEFSEDLYSWCTPTFFNAAWHLWTNVMFQSRMWQTVMHEITSFSSLSFKLACCWMDSGELLQALQWHRKFTAWPND